jgi:hypothetical protein
MNNKLQLRRETLRTISSETLEHVHGGTFFTTVTGVGTGVWAGAATAVGAGAKWLNDHLPKKNPNAGYKPYGY